ISTHVPWSSVIGPALAFFFQAEDGIRDLYVTGVQTCALPILRPESAARGAAAAGADRPRHLSTASSRRSPRWLQIVRAIFILDRSEERRVGKECRSRGSPAGSKQKRRVQQGTNLVDRCRSCEV